MEMCPCWETRSRCWLLSKFLKFYGIRKFIAVFTRDGHRWIQSTLLFYFSQIRFFNIMFLSTFWSSSWPPYFNFSQINPVFTPVLPYTCQISESLILLHLIMVGNIWWLVQWSASFFTHFLPVSCYFVSLTCFTILIRESSLYIPKNFP
jgi:hypothetical protein